MMFNRRAFVGSAWLVLWGVLVTARIQAQVPNYILSPTDQSRFSEDPRLLDPQRYTNPILFDTVLDPTGGLGPLPQAAKDILISHRIAQQQVDLAIQYLEANKARILAGLDTRFNRVFGNIATPQPAAMLASSNTYMGQPSVTGTASVGNGGYSLQTSGQAGTLWASQLRPGDWIAIDNAGATSNTNNTTATRPTRIFTGTALVRRVERVEYDGSNVTIWLDRNGPPLVTTGSGTTGSTNTTIQNAAISKVLIDRNRNPYFLMRGQSSVLDQVIDTFKAIRDALNGISPDDQARLQHVIRYNGQFKKFTDIWQRGDGLVNLAGVSSDQTPNDMPSWYTPGDPAYADNPPFIPDRRLREAGFSTSVSRDHIDAVMADRFGIPTRYDPDTDRPLSDRGAAGRPDQSQPAIRPGVIDALPVLWTEDNDAPDHPFFNNRQLLFTIPNLVDPDTNAIEVYVGPSFYSGVGFQIGGDGVPRLKFVTDRFDHWRTLAASNMGLEWKLITDPYGTDRTSDSITLLLLRQNPNMEQLPPLQRELLPAPNTGTPDTLPVQLRQWQLIIRTFAEWTTDFTHLSSNNVPDVGIVGLTDMLTRIVGLFQGNVAAPIPGQDLSLLAMDADKYARFAGMVTVSGGTAGGAGPVEPAGKRAVAGFYPVVFRQ